MTLVSQSEILLVKISESVTDAFVPPPFDSFASMQTLCHKLYPSSHLVLFSSRPSPFFGLMNDHCCS